MSSNKNQSDLNIPTNSASLKQKQRQQLGIKSEIGASTSDVYDPQVASYLSAGDSPSQFANTALHHSNSVGYSASAAAAAAELQHRAELQRRQQQLQQQNYNINRNSYNNIDRLKHRLKPRRKLKENTNSYSMLINSNNSYTNWVNFLNSWHNHIVTT